MVERFIAVVLCMTVWVPRAYGQIHPNAREFIAQFGWLDVSSLNSAKVGKHTWDNFFRQVNPLSCSSKSGMVSACYSNESPIASMALADQGSFTSISRFRTINAKGSVLRERAILIELSESEDLYNFSFANSILYDQVNMEVPVFNFNPMARVPDIRNCMSMLNNLVMLSGGEFGVCCQSLARHSSEIRFPNCNSIVNSCQRLSSWRDAAVVKFCDCEVNVLSSFEFGNMSSFDLHALMVESRHTNCYDIIWRVLFLELLSAGALVDAFQILEHVPSSLKSESGVAFLSILHKPESLPGLLELGGSLHEVFDYRSFSNEISTIIDYLFLLGFDASAAEVLRSFGLPVVGRDAATEGSSKNEFLVDVLQLRDRKTTGLASESESASSGETSVVSAKSTLDVARRERSMWLEALEND